MAGVVIVITGNVRGVRMKKVIHVNQHNIRSNAKGKDHKPVLTVKDYKSNTKCDEAKLVVGGRVIGRFVYSPHKPLSCGA